MSKQSDPITELGIRLSVLSTQVEMVFSRCDKIQYTVEEAIAAQNEKIKDLHRKIDILAGAVKKLAKAQGCLGENKSQRENLQPNTLSSKKDE